MSGEVFTSIIGGATGAAFVTGVFSLIKYWLQRKNDKDDKKETEDDVQMKALRYIMLYIIQERAKSYIAAGEITIEERRSLHDWHDLYHNGLHGNGDADGIMKNIDHLKLKIATNNE